MAEKTCDTPGCYLIFPRITGHQVKNYIMIHNEVISEKEKQKKYSQEFKREAVGLVVDQGYSKAEAGRSLDVNPNLIRRWQLEFETEGDGAFPGHGKLTPDQKRIRDLEAENRRLRMEKDILKKTTVFFVQESS